MNAFETEGARTHTYVAYVSWNVFRTFLKEHEAGLSGTTGSQAWFWLLEIAFEKSPGAPVLTKRIFYLPFAKYGLLLSSSSSRSRNDRSIIILHNLISYYCYWFLFFLHYACIYLYLYFIYMYMDTKILFRNRMIVERFGTLRFFYVVAFFLRPWAHSDTQQHQGSKLLHSRMHFCCAVLVLGDAVVNSICVEVIFSKKCAK